MKGRPAARSQNTKISAKTNQVAALLKGMLATEPPVELERFDDWKENSGLEVMRPRLPSRAGSTRFLNLRPTGPQAVSACDLRISLQES